MNQRLFITTWCILLILILTPNLRAEESAAYKLYLELGQKAMSNGDYENARRYLKQAHDLIPTANKPLNLLNATQRISQGEVRTYSYENHQFLEPPEMDWAHVTPKEKKVKPWTTQIKKDKPKKTSYERKSPPVKASRTARVESKGKRVVSMSEVRPLQNQEIIYLDQRLWETQPKTTLYLDLNTTTVLEGENIERYIILTEGYIEIERIDRDRVLVKALKRGSTFIHLWDETGRWTFKIEVTLPLRLSKTVIKEKKVQEDADPFRFTYSADWGSFYRGNSFDNIDRENLDFLQKISYVGDTPYGKTDGFVVFNKFDESTEATGYGFGLSETDIGPFKDINLRGVDIAKKFSELSMPGQFLRGVLFESKVFGGLIDFSYVRGRDRAIFGFLSPGVLEKRESFVEGFKVTAFANQESNVSFNFARGYGKIREPFLKDKVFTIQGQRKIGNFFIESELGYDEEDVAHTIYTKYSGNNYNLGVNFRNIEDEYATITSLPGSRGEIGGTIYHDYRANNWDLRSSLDIYRDRLFFNPEDRRAVNLDFNSSLNVRLDSKNRFRSSVFYVDTPGELSPRENFRFSNIYTKQHKLFDQFDTTTFLGGTYQRSRFDLSPSSEYDRYSISGGVTVGLIKNLNYHLNYEYSWVDEKLSGDVLNPSVMNTGLSYTRKFAEYTTGNINLNYRNEENTEGNNSFLAGEDSLSTSVGVSYRPNNDFELFVDGRIRNVWGEADGAPAFNEVDVRAGVRTSWDFPWVWNPKGYVQGFVYKDVNNNQAFDEGEEGVSGVTVFVGNKNAVTDHEGFFAAKVKAKKVQVSLDLNSVPKGFIFTTPISQDVSILAHRAQTLNFGLTTQSGIYGIVYFDENGNERPDPGDTFIPQVRIILNDSESVLSDFEGTYFFKNVQQGEHKITIDVNSIPIEYLPKIKIENVINLQEGITYVYHIPLLKAE